MGAQIPSSIGEIDSAWFASALGWKVDSITSTQVGYGVGVSSALYRCALVGANCPSSVIVKLPALDDAAVFTSTMLRMYIREAKFFTSLIHEMPINVPIGYYSAIDEETSKFVVVMEDLGSLRVIDQNVGMGIDDARSSVEAIARMHAKWWGDGDALAASGTTVSLGDPIYPAVLPFVFGEGWAKVTTEMMMPKAILEIGPRFSEAIPKLLSSMVVGPNTLCHGDYRADNILFNAAGEPVVIDFQLLGSGTGAYDIAYFVTQSLTPEVASRHERELFDLWVASLIAAGAPAELVDRDELWLHYRSAALFCLAYPVIASRGMDLSDERQRMLIEVMTNRFDRAVRELDLASLL